MNVCEKCGSPVMERDEYDIQYQDGKSYIAATWTVYECVDQPDPIDKCYFPDSYCNHVSYTCKEI